MSKAWFTPRPGYDGPPIELTAGWHDRNGKFHPKHVSRTGGPSRLRKRPRRRIQMVGDPPNASDQEIYAMQIPAKQDPPPDGPPVNKKVMSNV